MHNKNIRVKHNYYTNLMKYVHLLPLNEKIIELKNMFGFYTNLKYQCSYFKSKYAETNHLKNVKKEMLSQFMNV